MASRRSRSSPWYSSSSVRPEMSDEIWDPGLQSERTRLAWVRTAVALSTGGLGAAGLSLRHGLPTTATGG
ncbi:DUF202 domain-containing protein, partial [Nonomuraea sp. NPDC005983]|uniref:DUF202 domain-containing protein n=1 Tax=Nonomuraea sp. NPDC005983 TaxID=3155595 RepID=UPI0033A515D1